MVFDNLHTPLPVALGDLGLPWNWRVVPPQMAIVHNTICAITTLSVRPMSPANGRCGG